MKSQIKKTTMLFAALGLALALGACSSKKKATDSTAPDGTATSEDGTPAIESTPMNFDASGSDSGKIQGLQSINFDYDKSTLTAEAKSKIQGNAD